MSNEEIARVLTVLGMIESWIGAVKEEALRRLQRGQELPGVELGWGRRLRIWDDEIDAAAHLLSMGLTKKQVFPVSTISPAQAEAALRQKGRWPRKTKANPNPRTPLDNLVKYTDPKPKISFTSK